MSRPISETQGDITREFALSQQIERAFNCKTEKNPKSYYIDFGCFRDGLLVAWLECKCRNNSSTQYPDYLLAASKAVHGLQYSKLTSVPFIFAVSFTDGVFYHVFKHDETYKIRYLRRSQEKSRNDPQDNEPCVVLTNDMMTRLK